MQRRELLKSLTLAGAGSLALPALAKLPAAPTGETAAAMAELNALLERKQAEFSEARWRISTPQQLAEANVMLLATLDHALDVYRSNDPARPWFMPFNLPSKKLLGDNPDAIYFDTLVSADYSYRIRGNRSGATYLSFTVELARSKDSSGKLGATLNDNEIQFDQSGNYEIIASAQPQPGNWLRLEAAAQSITVRNYFEQAQCVGKDQTKHIAISIEPLTPPGPPPMPSDALIAAGIRRACEWLDKNVVAVSDATSPPWVSRVPNQFAAPVTDDSNQNLGYAAKDNTYLMAPWVLAPDEALVITGRFPKARFCNVVLWNQFMQTLDYRYRQTSLNRQQTRLHDDGSFTMVLAHQNPGVPNWLDTEGRPFGLMFWRFMLAEEAIQPLQTQVIKLADLATA